MFDLQHSSQAPRIRFGGKLSFCSTQERENPAWFSGGGSSLKPAGPDQREDISPVQSVSLKISQSPPLKVTCREDRLNPPDLLTPVHWLRLPR
ncbi:hypothetical protein EYF80_032707 [Liparis tanakae]|uniref:Uncharacterized protein n=1 Tax=Liparis tanakae TaxID=230148 RepID=A0A4Z2GWJ7_9TELE|nr:hypothetical protein EYF80_032707 [Liparis tanakae]